MDAVRTPASRGRGPAGDKGYSRPHIRAWPRRHRVRAVVPYREDQRPDDRRHRFDPAEYRGRAAVEPRVGWPRESRAVGTRSDRPAVNRPAAVRSAMARRHLRGLIARTDSADRA
jgi:hypothetical protein